MPLCVPTISTIFVLLLLLVSTEMRPRMVAEAKTCNSQSLKFHGKCRSNTNCASICQSEGFPGGKCKGVILFRKCICKKPCE
ncbi:unnamed protein product [Lupinus luteus]|uniref:Knottins-like domain-containing protein n=1 Tax=Lupinus luteus TaxID=3873 RepID=A0AAV1WVN1_LUPLU